MTDVIGSGVFPCVFVLPVYFYFMAPEILNSTLFAIFSVLIAFADIKTGAIPRIAFVFAFPFLFIIKTAIMGLNHLWGSTTGMLLGLAIFLLAFFVLKGKLGLADVWYSALIGMMLGPRYWYVSTGIACVTGIIFMLVSKRPQIPFIPFMAAGSISMSIFHIFNLSIL